MLLFPLRSITVNSPSSDVIHLSYSDFLVSGLVFLYSSFASPLSGEGRSHLCGLCEMCVGDLLHLLPACFGVHDEDLL